MTEDASFQANLIQGINKFQGARAKAFWKEMFSHLRGKPAELLSFDDIKQRLRLREESYKGLQDVPLDQIIGSVGRYQEFTRDFLPKGSVSRDRWSRVYAATSSMTGLNPVELYKVGDAYFVRDGNHRISVARQLGAKSIEAHVTELPTAVELHAGMSAKDIDDATAYAAFLEETNLGHTRRHHVPMRLTERSRYADLLGHIYMHKAFLEHLAQREIPLSEAAIHWYDTVYRPAITLIRKYNVQQQLGARTEADLYLWLVDHLRELREQYGDETPSRKISDALVDFLSERRIPIPDELPDEDDDSVILSRTQMMRAVTDMNARQQVKNDKEDEIDDPTTPDRDPD